MLDRIGISKDNLADNQTEKLDRVESSIEKLTQNVGVLIGAKELGECANNSNNNNYITVWRDLGGYNIPFNPNGGVHPVLFIRRLKEAIGEAGVPPEISSILLGRHCNQIFVCFRCIYEVTVAIDTHLAPTYITFPKTHRTINRIKHQFMDRFQMPGVIEAIDGTHVAILKPDFDEKNFISRKGYHSINVQIVCDPSLEILNINANCGGSSHDCFIWRQSSIKDLLHNHYANGRKGVWLIGDSGYLLEPYWLTSFDQPEKDTPEAAFNSRHAAARNCVERCIGLLKTRFRTFNRKAAKISKSQTITGGGPPVDKKLTDFELKILDILGKTFCKGSGVQEHGVRIRLMHFRLLPVPTWKRKPRRKDKCPLQRMRHHQNVTVP
ncbi:hypothetical protein ILUMI_25317 [Ignelater luminosus]|uniref:DDE Tnp4 domain-containing protein n=1 Tax=Ignelater luminosus TaxID=2038154 RepID=A0A8K0C8S7_IGNLU|nr:hypothetical protein ILUMI_25317 [Ignelater luminosus]